MAKTPLDPYQKRLVAFLSVATFFEGYDFFALAQILPELRHELDLDPAAAGWLIAFVNFGTMLAGPIVRQADRIGRRQILAITILGYTVASLATALTTNAWSFALCQLAARAFLIGEWAVAMVIAAEEFPAERRATIIGVIQASASFGGIVCAGLVPIMLKTDLGWRLVYVVGAIPLLVVAFLRRNMRETSRFAEVQAAAPDPSHGLAHAQLGWSRITELLTGPYRRRIGLLGLVWALTYICTQSSMTFWKEFAVGERGLTDGQVGASLSIAALVALPLLVGVGRLLDSLGRRKGGALLFVVASAGVFGAYTLHGQGPLTVALVLAVFGTSAVLPVLNAYTTELFPTRLRGDAFALANNLLGRIGFIIAPILVGQLAGHWGFGWAVAVTAATPIIVLVLIALFFPETSGRELEDTSAL